MIAFYSNFWAIFSIYKQLLTAAAALKLEWKFYNKKSGWQLKASGKKRAAFYLLPLENSFHYGMALKAEERELLLESDLLADITELLKASEKVMEGYPLRMVVTSQSQIDEIIRILRLVKRI